MLCCLVRLGYLVLLFRNVPAPPARNGGAVHNMHSSRPMRCLSFCLLTALICAGCAAPTWTKPGLTQAEFLRDRYECERDSELVGAMPTGPYGGLILATAQVGLLARKREMKDMCMRAKGYVQGDEPSVDAGSTLQAAPASPPAGQAATASPPSSAPNRVESTRAPNCPGASVWNGQACTAASGVPPTVAASTPTVPAEGAGRSLATIPPNIETPRATPAPVLAITPAWLMTTWNGMYRGREVSIRILDDASGTMTWTMTARTSAGVSVGLSGAVHIGVANNTRVVLVGSDLSGARVSWRLTRNLDMLRGEVLTAETSEPVVLRPAR